jgi:hypothetical protein
LRARRFSKALAVHLLPEALLRISSGADTRPVKRKRLEALRGRARASTDLPGIGAFQKSE